MYDRDPMARRSREAALAMADTTVIGIRLLVGVQVWKIEDVCSHATAKDGNIGAKKTRKYLYKG